MTKNELLPILDSIAKGIADTFGPCCETLVQDLDTTSHPVLSIYNGAVSGRSIGSTTDVLGTTTDNTINIEKLRQPHINMLAERNGRLMKSTTLPVSVDDGVLGLGINFDYTELSCAAQALKALTQVNGYLTADLRQNQQPQIDSLFEEAAQALYTPAKQLDKQQRQQLLVRLHLNHFFEQQRAIPYLAEQLNVSRYTIYKDLKELEIN